LFLSRDCQGAVLRVVTEPRPLFLSRDCQGAVLRVVTEPRPLFLSRDCQGAVLRVVTEPRPSGSGLIDRRVSGENRGLTANPSRVGDTEAYQVSDHDHRARCRGRHQGVRRGRRRCVPALLLRRQAPSPSPSAHPSLYSRSAFSAPCEQSRLSPTFSPPTEESNGHS
jgi:hypothetical protein